jgi:hypothetical protein
MGNLARNALLEAAEAYGSAAVRGRAYVEFDLAICDIYDGLVADGCERSQGILLDVPVEHRIAMVKTRAKDVLDAVPSEARNIRAVREFKETLRAL